MEHMIMNLLNGLEILIVLQELKNVIIKVKLVIKIIHLVILFLLNNLIVVVILVIG